MAGFNSIRVISVQTINVKIRTEKGGKVSLDNRLSSSVEGLGGQGGALDDTQGLASTFVNGLEHCAQTHALKEQIEAFDLLCVNTTSVCRRMVEGITREEAAWC